MLKNRKTNEPLWVLIFTLEPKEGKEKEAEEAKAKLQAEVGNDEVD